MFPKRKSYIRGFIRAWLCGTEKNDENAAKSEMVVKEYRKRRE